MTLRRAAFAALMLVGSCAIPPQRPVPPAAPMIVAPPPPPATVARGQGIRLTGYPQQGALLAGQLAPGIGALTLDGSPVDVAADGRFVIGFGRDAGPASVLRAVLPNGSATELALAVAPRDWPVEIVGTVPRRAQPTAEFERLRAAELTQINAARLIRSASGGWQQAFVWPVRGRISGRFGAQRIYKGGEKGDPHSGTDIAAASGTPVAAPADGVVILAADHPFTLEGNLLMIDHGMGLNSAFLHLSRLDVKLGEAVRQGQIVGAVGMTGRASGPHLHWGMKWHGARIDPQLVAGAMR